MTATLSRIFSRTSADGVWGFLPPDDEEADRTCIVQHLPTGLQQGFTSLGKAETWAASSDALDLLQAQAWEGLRGCAGDYEKTRAVAALEWFGVLLPAGTPVDSRCECGGYLSFPDATQGRRHVNTCDAELFTGRSYETVIRGDLVACPDLAVTHKVCDRPTPVPCGHAQCVRASRIVAVGCDRHDNCCGCCQGES